jgi:hypothetical protein
MWTTSDESSTSIISSPGYETTPSLWEGRPLRAGEGSVAVDKDRIRICIPEVTRPVIGKLLEHVKALSGPESPTLPEGE